MVRRQSETAAAAKKCPTPPTKYPPGGQLHFFHPRLEGEQPHAQLFQIKSGVKIETESTDETAGQVDNFTFPVIVQQNNTKSRAKLNIRVGKGGGLQCQELPKSWHCQNWLTPPNPGTLVDFATKSA